MNQPFQNYDQTPKRGEYQPPYEQGYQQPAAYSQQAYTQQYLYQQQYMQPPFAPQPRYIPQQNTQHPYAQVPYAPQAAGYVPSCAPGRSVPPFAINNVRKLRKKAGTKAVNRMSMLALSQLVLAVLWQLPIGYMIGFFGLDLSNEYLYLLLTAMLVPLSTALPAAIYLIFNRSEAAEYLKFERGSFLVAFLCIIAGFGICMAANYPALGVQSFLEMFGYERSETVGSVTTTVGGYVLEVLVLAVLVPILEEFAFRGIIFSVLKKYGVAFAVVSSSLIFGCMHLDLSSVVFATICGVVFALVYVITDNLWVSVAIHALNNFISVTTNDIEIFFIEEVGALVNTVLMLVPMILGIVALVLLIVLFRKKIKIKEALKHGFVSPLTAGETSASIFRAAATWALFAAVIIETLFATLVL